MDGGGTAERDVEQFFEMEQQMARNLKNYSSNELSMIIPKQSQARPISDEERKLVYIDQFMKIDDSKMLPTNLISSNVAISIEEEKKNEMEGEGDEDPVLMVDSKGFLFNKLIKSVSAIPEDFLDAPETNEDQYVEVSDEDSVQRLDSSNQSDTNVLEEHSFDHIYRKISKTRDETHLKQLKEGLMAINKSPFYEDIPSNELDLRANEEIQVDPIPLKVENGEEDMLREKIEREVLKSNRDPSLEMNVSNQVNKGAPKEFLIDHMTFKAKDANNEFQGKIIETELLVTGGYQLTELMKEDQQLDVQASNQLIPSSNLPSTDLISHKIATTKEEIDSNIINEEIIKSNEKKLDMYADGDQNLKANALNQLNEESIIKSFSFESKMTKEDVEKKQKDDGLINGGGDQSLKETIPSQLNLKDQEGSIVDQISSHIAKAKIIEKDQFLKGDSSLEVHREYPIGPLSDTIAATSAQEIQREKIVVEDNRDQHLPCNNNSSKELNEGAPEEKFADPHISHHFTTYKEEILTEQIPDGLKEANKNPSMEIYDSSSLNLRVPEEFSSGIFTTKATLHMEENKKTMGIEEENGVQSLDIALSHDSNFGIDKVSLNALKANKHYFVEEAIEDESLNLDALCQLNERDIQVLPIGRQRRRKDEQWNGDDDGSDHNGCSPRCGFFNCQEIQQAMNLIEGGQRQMVIIL